VDHKLKTLLINWLFALKTEREGVREGGDASCVFLKSQRNGSKQFMAKNFMSDDEDKRNFFKNISLPRINSHSDFKFHMQAPHKVVNF
jgi:hypothetical protein